MPEVETFKASCFGNFLRSHLTEAASLFGFDFGFRLRLAGILVMDS